MVDIIGRAKVIVETDVDQRSADAAGGKIGSALKTGALVGAAALGTVAVAGFKAFQAFEEAEKESRKLANVLGNMGKGGAADDVEKLADSLMRVTGVDDEVIKGGQTILATFSEVAASAGEVGGTFERATRLSLDLAAVMGGDISGASRQLGKALQDPVKGIAALGRAGVTFTEEQKALIEGFVAANDVASAQALILAEVEKQVGGTAEASATGSERIATAVGEAQESIGALLSDLFDTGGEKSFMDLAADSILKMSDKVTEFQTSDSWTDLKSEIRDFGRDVKTVADAIGSVTSNLDKLSRTITGDKNKGLLWWLGQIDKRTNPLRLIASTIQNIKDALKGDVKIPAWLRFLMGGGADSVLGDQDRGQRDDGPIPGLASGGPARGLRLVGENGPELAHFGDTGGYVYNNSQTRDILDGVRGDTINQTYVFNGPGSLSEARREGDWGRRYGTRFGAATVGAAL